MAFGVAEWVYPRVCGGNPAPPFVRAAAAGSIPACAGEPITVKGGCTIGTVYPRVCGGTAYTAVSAAPR